MGLGSPSGGGRVLLERRSEDAVGATYRVELRSAEDVWEGEARIAVDGGDVTLDGLVGAGGGEPPAWLVDGARAFLRTAWRDVTGPNAGRWPRRIHRWRAAR